ncbi:MAG: hypothetical protein ACLT0Y_07925 [Christensenellales bacterium]
MTRKGRPIGSYAARCIENEILMSLRQEKKSRGDCDGRSDRHGQGRQPGRLIDIMGVSPDCLNRRKRGWTCGG